MQALLKRYGKRPLLILALGLIYAVLLAACRNQPVAVGRIVEGGNPQLGVQLFQQYGCGGCHVIPGVERADQLVGPPLIGWGERVYIAGRVPNTPENLIAWIQNPQAIDPENAMPNLGVTEQDARHMSAYLYTLMR
jgi:cytochrome c